MARIWLSTCLSFRLLLVKYVMSPSTLMLFCTSQRWHSPSLFVVLAVADAAVVTFGMVQELWFSVAETAKRDMPSR